MTVAELLESLGIEFRRHGEHHHTSAGRVSIDCCRCSPGSRRFRLGIRVDGKGASCWSCGFVPLLSALMEASGKDFRTVKGLVEQLDSLPSRGLERVQGKLVVPDGVGPLLKVHRKYLEGRGFDPDYLADVWGVQGIGMTPRLPWRLFIPVTLEGKMVSWTTRSLVDHGLRYVSAGAGEEAYPHKHLLLGDEMVGHAAVVVEGPFDAMAIGPGAVATMGTSYSREQVWRLAKFPQRVVVFDSEPAAQARARRLARELEGFPGRTCTVTLGSKDAASSPRSEIRELRKRFLE